MIARGTFGRIVSKNAYSNKFAVGSEIIECETEIELKIYIMNQTTDTITIK